MDMLWTTEWKKHEEMAPLTATDNYLAFHMCEVNWRWSKMLLFKLRSAWKKLFISSISRYKTSNALSNKSETRVPYWLVKLFSHLIFYCADMKYRFSKVERTGILLDIKVQNLIPWWTLRPINFHIISCTTILYVRLLDPRYLYGLT